MCARLELVLEVGERAQAADDDRRAAPPAVVGQQALERVDLQRAARCPARPTISVRRCSSENSGALRTFSASATTTRSKIFSDRRRMSTWPFVIGSKVPG